MSIEMLCKLGMRATRDIVVQGTLYRGDLGGKKKLGGDKIWNDGIRNIFSVFLRHSLKYANRSLILASY